VRSKVCGAVVETFYKGLNKIREFIEDIINGIRCGYPICCVLEYSIDRLRGIEEQAYRKGFIIKDGKIQDFVPCFIHRRLYKRISYEDALRVLNPGYHVKVRFKSGGVPEITYMPMVTCWKCGSAYFVEHYTKEAIVACRNCGAKTRVENVGGFYNWKFEPVGAFVDSELVYELLKEIKPILSEMTEVEQIRLIEAAKCLLIGAYTACESMCYDALVSVLRRVYGGQKELGYYVQKMENDPDLKNVRGAIAYFALKRHEVDHPERISDELEAKNALDMTKQLIREILTKKTRAKDCAF